MTCSLPVARRKPSLSWSRSSAAMSAGLAFVVELEFLNGRNKLAGYDLFSLLKYQS
jgi:adenine/guanine phosphoribosyltransferase-like PRPP-binding protein